MGLDYAKISAAALSELATIPNLSDITINCDSFDPQTGMPLEEFYLTDEAAKALGTFRALRSAALFHTRITDDGIQALCNLERLETLVVSSRRVTSASFASIATLRRLKHLGTWGWRVDDADLAKLGQLPSLVELSLQTHLTNEGVRHLSLLDLERLTLRGNEVTEESVPLLCKMHSLKWLNVSDTAIPKNSAAAALLRQSLPGCTIRFPKTAPEKERERNFNSLKWGGL